MGQSVVELVIVVVSMFVALLLSVFLILACFRRWRLPRLFPNRASASHARVHFAKDEDLETPLVSDDIVHTQVQNNNLARNLILEERNFHGSRNHGSPRRHGIVGKQTTASTDVHVKQDGSLVVEIAPDALENVQVGQTLKYTGVPIRPHDGARHARKESVDDDLEKHYEDDSFRVTEDNAYKRSCLTLEVISGPAIGLHCTRDLSDNSRLQVTLGRVTPNDLLLKDSEVSGKHAVINWNPNKSKWELVDMGSLNGTFLNSQAIHHPDSARRQWSDPVELANGDIITLGTSSRILVKIAPFGAHLVPFGVGMASEPMAMRRGAKKLPMEDASYCQWPLPGVEQFGLFCIFDGHGGAGAAKAASKILPRTITNILSNPESRVRVLSLCDASEVLRDAFSDTEAAMDHQYEGCTATVLLVWVNRDNQLIAQCANVGDSACVINIGGQLVSMTEDHRVTSPAEQARLREEGRPLKEGESRLCGINLVRMLGDKFLKEQESRFSAKPFISQAVPIDRANIAFALMASDGLWDVISMKKAVQLILKAKERDTAHDNNADWIANLVLNEARTLRTKDNTSVIFLDFGIRRTEYCNTSF